MGELVKEVVLYQVQEMGKYGEWFDEGPPHTTLSGASAQIELELEHPYYGQFSDEERFRILKGYCKYYA